MPDLLQAMFGAEAVPAENNVDQLTVTFKDAALGPFPRVYDWDFGDGSEHAIVANPVHRYEKAGSYTVRLTIHTGTPQADDEQAQWSELKIAVGGDLRTTSPHSYPVGESASAAVESQPLAAVFAVRVLDAANPLQVNFDDASTGPVTGRRWEFGDNGRSTAINPIHVYGAPGSYTVKLEVRSSTTGGSAVGEQVIEVAAIPA